MDYGQVGGTYSAYRQPDPTIASFINAALGSARNVLNVGAGAGSYEPADREVVAVEPSAAMRAQRPPGLPPAIDAQAENLPFADRAFDASMAIFTLHQWADLNAGLREMRRVTAGPIVVLTCDPDELGRFWLADYAPDAIETETRRYPPIARIVAEIGARCSVRPAPVPLDCRDGFNEAYYGRPEKLLDPAARLACSAWSFVPPEAVKRFEAHLRRDLADGTWDRRYGSLRRQPAFEGSLKVIVGSP
jgi:SAM-dependent methyltransferase